MNLNELYEHVMETVEVLYQTGDYTEQDVVDALREAADVWEATTR